MAPRLWVREIVDALDQPMQRRGFERRNPGLAEAEPEAHWVAAWLREPPEDRIHDVQLPDGTPHQVGFYDGVSVWSSGEGGWVNVGVAQMVARVEWRNSHLDADEFACVVAGIVDQVDRFIPHTGPPLRQKGWTRG